MVCNYLKGPELLRIILKRELNDEDIAVLKRAVSLGGLGGQLGKGILTGAGLTAAIDGIEHLIGGDSSSK